MGRASEEFDRKLFTLKLSELSRQMQIESVKSDRAAARQGGGLDLIRMVDGQLAVLSRWLEGVDRICREVWQTLGGMELGSVWRRLGAKVTIVEYLDRILPGLDAEIASEAQKIFQKQGFEFRLRSKVLSAKVESGTCVVRCQGAEPIQCDRVLVAVGRKPNTAGLNLESVKVQTDGKGRIQVNEHFATSAPGIFAIGDVIRGPMLAHKAEEEGIACVEHIVTGFGHVDYDAIPGIVYTQPEIATVGKTEAELREAGIEFNKGTFPFRANGRAQALAQVDGKVKILADRKTDRLLGVHIIGPRAGDLIAEAAAAIAFKASSEDIARCPHAHPTLAEAFKEAALSTLGRAIHM